MSRIVENSVTGYILKYQTTRFLREYYLEEARVFIWICIFAGTNDCLWNVSLPHLTPLLRGLSMEIKQLHGLLRWGKPTSLQDRDLIKIQLGQLVTR
jgi:hypothetical protein